MNFKRYLIMLFVVFFSANSFASIHDICYKHYLIAEEVMDFRQIRGTKLSQVSTENLTPLVYSMYQSAFRQQYYHSEWGKLEAKNEFAQTVYEICIVEYTKAK